MKLIPLLLMLVLSGCFSMQFSSGYNQETKVPVKRAFILCKDSYRDAFLKDFTDILNTKLNQRNIQTKSLSVNELSFISAAQIDQSIKDYNPDVIITLNRDANNLERVKSGYVYGGGLYYLGIKKAGSDTDYWKAMINTANEDALSDKNIDKGLDNILDKFQSETEK